MKLLRYIKHKNSRHFFGLLAEYIAILSYLCRFYSILAHRYKSKVGEIDFIAKRGKKIIFVEVKARQSGLAGGMDLIEGVVSFKQQQRLKRTAELFVLRNTRYYVYDMRFDLVVVNYLGWPVRIKNFI